MSSFFAFESEQERSLALIPMVVRMKLDVCGVKLTLKQWQQLPMDMRRRLLEQPCDGAYEVLAYYEMLVSAALRYTTEAPEPLSDQGNPAWEELNCVPQQLLESSTSAGVAPPTLDQWRGLTPLQRFALLKLTRSGHLSSNFLPAVQEFQLT